MSRIRADQILNSAGTGAPNFSQGLQVGAATTIHTTGIDLGSGNIQSHNINSAGIITARSGFHVTGAGSSVGIGTDKPEQSLHVRGDIRVKTSRPVVRYKSLNDAHQYFAGADVNNTFDGGYQIGVGHGIGVGAAGTTVFCLTSAARIGIGTTVPNAKLEVRDGKIRAGTDQSTQGTTIIEGRYTDEGDILNILGSEYSSGATVLSYGMRPKTGSSGYLSSFDNFSGGRNALVLGTDGAKIVTASSQQTTVGSDVTGVASAVMVNINGDVTMRGTDSQYLEMASFKTTNGSTLTSNNGGFLSFTPIENSNSSVIVHSTSTNPTRITFPVAGVVHLNFHQDIRSGNATTSSHYDYMNIHRNGSGYVNSLITSTSGFWGNIHGTATIEVAANDYIELKLLTNTSISSWDDNGWSSYNFVFAPINTNR